MDNINFVLAPEMCNELGSPEMLLTLKFYLEEHQEFEGMAIMATQVASYIASYGTQNENFRNQKICDQLLELVKNSTSTEAKSNAAECLAVLIKDAETRSALEKDERIEKLILELPLRKI